MPLTPKQAAFVDFRMTGATNRDAAARAGYSARTAAAAGARLGKHPAVVAELQRRRADARRAVAAPSSDNADCAQAPVHHVDPMAYLLQTMNDPGVDLRLRVDAAKAMLPFVHARAGGRRQEGCPSRRRQAGRKGQVRAAGRAARAGAHCERVGIVRAGKRNRLNSSKRGKSKWQEAARDLAQDDR